MAVGILYHNGNSVSFRSYFVQCRIKISFDAKMRAVVSKDLCVRAACFTTKPTTPSQVSATRTVGLYSNSERKEDYGKKLATVEILNIFACFKYSKHRITSNSSI